MVINFDDATKPGTHWAAIYASSSLHAIYFDSLGLGMDHVVRIGEYVRGNFAASTQQHLGLQSRGSTVCGYYAAFFIYACAQKIPFLKLEALLAHMKNPDGFVKDFVTRVL